MTKKPKRLPKLTDAERHKRFLETAREIEASEEPKDFDEAFNKVVHPKGGSNPGSMDQKK
jgi:hypothetical protein